MLYPGGCACRGCCDGCDRRDYCDGDICGGDDEGAIVVGLMGVGGGWWLWAATPKSRRSQSQKLKATGQKKLEDKSQKPNDRSEKPKAKSQNQSQPKQKTYPSIVRSACFMFKYV